MAAEVWPAGLPQRFMADGYSESVADGRIRSEMDAGPAKVRLRSSAASRGMAGTFWMSTDELEEFVAFVSGTLAGGSLAFEFPSQIGGSAHLARFAEMPSWSNLAVDLWLVSISLEILP